MTDDGISFSEARQMDMNKAVVNGYDSATTVLLAALERAGANRVKFGYREEDPDGLWPEKPITAYCEVFAQKDTPVDNPGKAILEAMARVVRFAGGKVTMM